MIPNSFANQFFFSFFLYDRTEGSSFREALHKRYDANRPIGLPFLRMEATDVVISWIHLSLRPDTEHDNDHHTKSPPHHAHKVLYLGNWYCSAWRVVPQ